MTRECTESLLPFQKVQLLFFVSFWPPFHCNSDDPVSEHKNPMGNFYLVPLAAYR